MKQSEFHKKLWEIIINQEEDDNILYRELFSLGVNYARASYNEGFEAAREIFAPEFDLDKETKALIDPKRNHNIQATRYAARAGNLPMVKALKYVERLVEEMNQTQKEEPQC